MPDERGGFPRVVAEETETQTMCSCSPTEVLQELARLGIEATVRDGSLHLRPGSRVPAELVPEIRAHRAAIVALLAVVDPEEEAARALPPEDGPEVRAVDGALRRRGWEPSTAVGRAMLAVMSHQAECSACARRIGGCEVGRELERRWLEEWSERRQEVVA